MNLSAAPTFNYGRDILRLLAEEHEENLENVYRHVLPPNYE